MPGPSSRALITALVLALAPDSSVTAELYQWTDSKGETHFVVTLDSLEIGGARVAPMRVVSHQAELEQGMAGFLGRDFLSHFRVSIDHARGMVELAPK